MKQLRVGLSYSSETRSRSGDWKQSMPSVDSRRSWTVRPGEPLQLDREKKEVILMVGHPEVEEAAVVAAAEGVVAEGEAMSQDRQARRRRKVPGRTRRRTRDLGRTTTAAM